MDFQFTEEQLAVKAAARDFAQNVLKPGVIERDREAKFPVEEIKQLGQIGFLGMMVDPKYGGGGMDSVSYVLAMEEISKIDASVSVCMSVCNASASGGHEPCRAEDETQRDLAPIARGDDIGGLCLSDAEAGADAKSQRATAETEGGHYLFGGPNN